MSINDFTGDVAAREAFDLDKILDKVAKLLAKAERTDNEAEAEAFRAGAEKLMNKYRLTEEEAYAANPEMKFAPARRMVRVCNYMSEHRDRYLNIFSNIASHTGIRMRYQYSNGGYVADCFGYEADLRYAEMLYSAAFLTFQSHVEPTWDDNLPEEENFFMLRASGMTRANIVKLAKKDRTAKDVAMEKRIQKAYERIAAERGVPVIAGRGVSRANYAEAYADGFKLQFARRLWAARDASDVSKAGALVLAGRAERVEEAFYTAHPGMRPQPKSTDVSTEVVWEDTRTEAQKLRDEKRWQREAEKRWQRAHSPEARAGQQMGKAAADSVPLQGIRSTGRIES